MRYYTSLIFLSSQKIVQSTVRFRFDGAPINENDTPQGLEMEDGDTIEVFTQQTGGGRGLLRVLPRPSPLSENVFHLCYKQTESSVLLLRTIQ